MQKVNAKNTQKGFTLIELLVVGALMLILSTVAIPAYNSFRSAGLVTQGLTVLEEGARELEASKQGRGVYGHGSCSVSLPNADNYLLSCQLTRGGYGYELRAIGVEKLEGYEYTLDETSTRHTLKHPNGAPAQACWSLQGTVCDYEAPSGS